MIYDSLSLHPVYDTINRIHGNSSIPPNIPRRGTSEYREYSSAAKQLIKNVPRDKAVYLWFSKNQLGKVECIYVGESHKNKDGLRGRFSDEFKQWYHIFWMTVYKSNKYEQDVIEMYNTPTKDYSTEVLNVSLKKGATHIVFCSHNNDSFDPLSVQNDLIQLFHNPIGNTKDTRPIPVHETKLPFVSKDIFLEFGKLIERSTPYSI